MFDAIAYFVYKIILGLLPLLAVIVLGKIAWTMWVHYVRQSFISGIDFVLLEIIPPRDVVRSPKAMELFISNALYHWSVKGGQEEYWQGAVWLWFSLEIVSIEGQVHFYIRTPTRLRALIETQMYAQYPQSQIKEAEDYTLAVDKISPTSRWNAWGCEFKLKNHQTFPLKTYADYGLDKESKEEMKIDPLSPVIELFASLKKGEQMWMQVIITPMKKEYHTAGTWFGKHDWTKESLIQLEEKLLPYTNVRRWDQDPKHFGLEVRAPRYMENMMGAVSAKTAKLGFETGIRICYVAKKEAFDMSNRRNMRLIFRQYARPDCNELMRFNSTQADAFGGVFMISPKTVMILADRMVHAYREREFFHLPMRHHLFNQSTIPWPLSIAFYPVYFHPQTYVLNTEEIATLWHFPGQILKTPSLARIESKEASPPPNLPV